MAVWMNRRVDLPWQSTNNRSLETLMFRNIAGLFEMAVCCVKPPYLESTQKVFFLISLKSTIHNQLFYKEYCL